MSLVLQQTLSLSLFLSFIYIVKQADIFFEQLSVRDQLTYTAQLRFPDKHVDQKERRDKIKTEVDRIIQLLRLTKVQDSPIMMCSGGEKKRVNIGTELITVSLYRLHVLDMICLSFEWL